MIPPLLESRRNTTGGYRWHARAFLHRQTWAETTRHIADWLDTTTPASEHLLLFGGSAGWMMSSCWLQRFTRVDLIDVDPWAPRLFRLNHGRALRASCTELRFIPADGLANLEAILALHPRASIFFDNMLGQQVYRTRNVHHIEALLAQLSTRLEGRDWGSIHDLFSGPVRRSAVPAHSCTRLEALIDERGLIAKGLRDQELHLYLLRQVGGYPDWMDHLTSDVFPTGARSTLIAWPFLKGYTHWLQAGWISR